MEILNYLRKENVYAATDAHRLIVSQSVVLEQGNLD
jgi:hypothetical protein